MPPGPQNPANPTALLTTAITDGDTTHAPDGNAVFDALYNNFETRASAASTTVLTAANKLIQETTGVTTHIYTLPVTSTLTAGRQFFLINNSTVISFALLIAGPTWVSQLAAVVPVIRMQVSKTLLFGAIV